MTRSEMQMMIRAMLLFALIIGLSGVAADEVTPAPSSTPTAGCPSWCSPLLCMKWEGGKQTAERTEYCGEVCQFCDEPEKWCDSFCSIATCDSFLCQGCQACKIPDGKKCDPKCNKIFDENWNWDGEWPPKLNCITTPDQCGGCPICNTCQTWCAPDYCENPYCLNCKFCKETFEPTPTCAGWCSDFVCADSQDFCSGCEWCVNKPDRCDQHCMVTNCADAACEDCKQCKPKPQPQCNAYCSKRSCNFGSEGYVRPCTGCHYCSVKEKPKKSKKSKSGSKSLVV